MQKTSPFTRVFDLYEALQGDSQRAQPLAAAQQDVLPPPPPPHKTRSHSSSPKPPVLGHGGHDDAGGDDADQRGREEPSRRCRRLNVVAAKGAGAKKVVEMSTESSPKPTIPRHLPAAQSPRRLSALSCCRGIVRQNILCASWSRQKEIWRSRRSTLG